METITITFPKPFSIPPVVVASIGSWYDNPDLPNNINDKEFISVSVPTTTSVKVRWTCISQKLLTGRKIKWIAIGK